jgi:hypothetical protein
MAFVNSKCDNIDVKDLRPNTSRGSEEVGHSPHHHKVEGLNPAASACSGREKLVKRFERKGH